MFGAILSRPPLFRRISLCLAVCFAAAFTSAATAADQSWVGKQLVMTRDGVQLLAKDAATGRNKVIGVVEEAGVRADKVQGDWIWVATATQKGWIKEEDAIPADQAIDYFSKRIAGNNNDGYAYNQRAMAWFNRGDMDRSLADISEAIRITPDRSPLRHNRAMIYQRKGQYNEALAEFAESLRLDQGYALAYSHRGDLYIEMREFDKAIADYTEAIRLLPGYAEAYAHRGWAWAEKGEFTIALSDMNEAIKLDAGLPIAYRGRAKVYDAQGDYDKALTDFNEAIRLLPGPGGGVIYSERGWTWIRKGDNNKAVADFSEAIRLDATVTYAYQGRGQAYQSLQKYEAAERDFSEFIRLQPKDPLPLLTRGWLYYEMAKYDKALADFSEAKRIDPQSAYSHRGRGKCYHQQGKLDQAVTELDELIRLMPTWDSGYLDRGDVWFAKKEYARAVDDYTSALKHTPANWYALRSRGIAHRLNRNFDSAIADLDEAKRLNPNEWTISLQRANTRRMMKQYDRAIEDYSETYRLNAKSAVAVAMRGFSRFQNGEYEAAIADFDLAEKIDPNDVWSYRARAMFHATSPEETYRDAAKARELLAKVRKMAANDAGLDETEAAISALEGEFDDAVRLQTIALQDPAYGKNPDQQMRLEIYRQKQPYREGMSLAAYTPPMETPQPADDGSRKVALLVGVNDYQKPTFTTLKYAENDVDAVATQLRRGGFEVTVLKGSAAGKSQATKQNIEAKLGELVKPLGREDVMVVMLCGHGQEIPVERADGDRREEAFFCPVDGVAGQPETLVSLSHMLDETLAPNVGRKMVLVDACRDVPKDPGRGSRGIQGRVIALPEDTAVLYSCRSGQRSFELDEFQHGVFTHCVVEGLKGQAAREGEVAWFDLVAHVTKQMSSADIRRRLGDDRQTPIAAGGVEHTVLARIGAGSGPKSP